MTDLEITKACAEAMGLTFAHDYDDKGFWIYESGSVNTPPRFIYSPLTNDAQAMALVKKLRLHVNDMQDGNSRAWGVFPGAVGGLGVYGKDLNRAICECVAKMHKEKA